MVYLWIALALLLAGELIIVSRLAALEKERAEEKKEERAEVFSAAVAEILSYDLEKAKEAMKNE